MSKPIHSVSEYITEINKIIKNHSNKIIVFRGEPKDYGETACIPNLFRNNYLEKNKYFEKNILDEMTANHIALGDNYLEKAINAQHDGFPSRFLDVSYNCLVALHFAITPHYKQVIDKHDDKDGKVFIYYFNDFVCPTGDGIVKNYNAIINHDEEWFNNPFFQQSYKLIDHIKINERIKAQNGAFIMFQGNTKISHSLYEELIIDKKSKSQIRKELKRLFGIDNSTMYPESSNLVENIVDKSKIANNTSFSFDNEFTLAKSIFEIQIDDFIKKIMLEKNVKTRDLLIRDLERFILYNTNHVIKLLNCESKLVVSELYNSLIEDKYKFLQKYMSKDFKIAESTKINKVKEKK